MYKGKPVVLATKHQKEDVIRPFFENGLGCSIHVPMHFDTDQFGTFTNEIPRKLSAYETLIQKAKEAAHQFDYRYAIAIEKAFQYSDTIRLETDMRAMMNPMRMQLIKSLAIKLENRIQQHCPQCDTPGFGKITTDGNLACQDCDTPTTLYQRKVLNCLKCEYKAYQAREDGLVFSDPKNCPYCNP